VTSGRDGDVPEMAWLADLGRLADEMIAAARAQGTLSARRTAEMDQTLACLRVRSSWLDCPRCGDVTAWLTGVYCLVVRCTCEVVCRRRAVCDGPEPGDPAVLVVPDDLS
jgi:hypothetical protein